MKLEGDKHTSTCNYIFGAFTKLRGRGRTKSYQKNEAKRGAAGCLILRERMNVHGPLKKGGASLSRFYHRVLHSVWGASLMVYLREEESGKFFTPKMAKIADFSIAKLQISGRFPQRSVEPFFHNIFEFRLQISRSQDPPVCKLSHNHILKQKPSTITPRRSPEIRKNKPFQHCRTSGLSG